MSDGNLGGRIQRQAYSGPILALALAPEGVAPGAAVSKTYPLSAGASSPASTSSSKTSGVVVTLGDDSVTPQPSFGAGSLAGPGGSTGAAGVGGGGGAGGNGRSPCVLKFWTGPDMGVCIRAVDVAAQMRDGQQQRWTAPGGVGAGGHGGRGRGAGVPRLTAFAVTPDATQVCFVILEFYWLLHASLAGFDGATFISYPAVSIVYCRVCTTVLSQCRVGSASRLPTPLYGPT